MVANMSGVQGISAMAMRVKIPKLLYCVLVTMIVAVDELFSIKPLPNGDDAARDLTFANPAICRHSIHIRLWICLFQVSAKHMIGAECAAVLTKPCPDVNFPRNNDAPRCVAIRMSST